MARYLTVSMMFVGVIGLTRPAAAIVRSWDKGAGGTNWIQANNWNPNGVPESDDVVRIGDVNAGYDETVIFGLFPPYIDTVSSLGLSNGADLDLNDGRLVVTNATTIGGDLNGLTLGDLLVSPVSGMQTDALDTETLTIHDEGRLVMSGGSVFVRGMGDFIMLTQEGLTVEAGGAIFGYGEINLDAGLTSAGVLLTNDGAITVGTPNSVVIGEPTPRTLSINAPNDPDLVRLLLGGDSHDGEVVVTRNSTLDLNAETLSMRGDIHLFGNSTLDLGYDFVFGVDGNVSVLRAESGETGGIVNLPALPAVVRGADFTLDGDGVISLADSDEVLQFESRFNAFGGTFNNNGTVHFVGDAAIGNTTNFNTQGTGRIVNDADSTLVLGGGLDADTPLTNHGVLMIVGPLNSGTAQVDSLVQSSTGTLAIDLGDVIPGDYDSLTVDGNALLDGTLEVTLIDGFVPIMGNSFTVLETVFGNISGEFDDENVPVFNDLTLEVIYTSTTVELEVVPAGLAGDYNDNGVVDAADYVVWRENDGTNNDLPNDPLGGMIGPAQYNNWRAHFGQSAGSGASLHATVPEPASALQLLSFAAAIAWGRRRVAVA